MTTEQTTTPQEGATPSTGTPATGTPSASGSATQPAKPTTTIEEALARIAELERHASNKEEEASRHGKKLTDAEKKLAAYEQKEKLAQEAALSEVEKASKRVAEVEAQNQQYKQQLITSQVKLAAQAKGIIDADIAALAIQDKLELGEDGMPTNVDKALDDLIKNKPYLAPKPAEPPTQEQTPPAQTATQQKPPATPAMNPGRTQISPPSAPQQQGKYQPPSWGDIYSKKQ